MSKRLAARLEQCRAAKRTAFVSFLTSGYPSMEATVPCLLALQEGGADIIEVGIPFSDPQADGATIQAANVRSLAGGMTLVKTLELVTEARSKGLFVPVILMGYLNPLLAYGVDKLAEDSTKAGVDGFIIVDLPGEQASGFITAFNANNLSFVPLVTPATTEERMAKLGELGSGFVYVVSVTGVTGKRDNVAGGNDITEYLATVKKHITLPVVVGFGVSKREHVVAIGEHADGCVVGSAIVAAVTKSGLDAAPDVCAQHVKELVQELTGGTVLAEDKAGPSNPVPVASTKSFDGKSDEYNFGKFGGRYIPETLAAAMEDLWTQWLETKEDPEFVAECDRLRREYIGGPTPLFFCKRLTEHVGGAQIWLKREDLAHTGAHKINNAIGQALLAIKLGKKRIIAETGAGQHGVATATACALFGLDCTVYMGAEDCKRQSLNVFRMNTLVIVRDLQSVMGREARAQFLDRTGKLPDVVTACVGGGSNAIGIFHPFVDDKEVRLVGVEAGGEKGVAGGPGHHSATLSHGKPGVLHGTMTYLLQDGDGQVDATHSISAGLDYPGVGPEHAHYKDTGRAEYVAVTDAECMEGFRALSQFEGIIPALETSHAISYAMTMAKTMPKDKTVLINVSGRGDKDMIQVARITGYDLGAELTPKEK
eukprot:gene9433-683_t